jgi:hypothetical protein
VAYGLNNDPSVHYVLIYDFGGGTLDCSVLYINQGLVQVLETTGDRLLGGEDFDQRMVTLLLEGAAQSLPGAASAAGAGTAAIDAALRCAPSGAAGAWAALAALGAQSAARPCSFSALKQGPSRYFLLFAFSCL